ncbi:homeobox protein onecut, putative [Pediculus humanus corporis]|uniref:One cut domain family member n=1 Tax=Pediculus humanus subsp. corporis TaxID=121224 RepID=E0VIJ5_PEDHC|nr:homeobox protein onecut, putative [Pediculus humanus corporis]EEB13201.1 homeobox protein onecut, putative [Pediculus humanus corporis]
MEVELRAEKCRLCLAENVYIRNEGDTTEELQDTICSNCCNNMFDVEEICESEGSDNPTNEAFSNGNVEHVSQAANEEEINTKQLAQQISAELKRYSIPQSVFAQKVLCRSQGTLSDLLRNPKPWSKLKSGRDTFRRMWKWLQEPEASRITTLRLACVDSLEKIKEDGFQKSTIPEVVKPKKPRLVFTDLQRRTLQAIFRETERPSKQMQVTIARQLDLEPSSVVNFFMNARRRSIDKWKDDKMEPESQIIKNNNNIKISQNVVSKNKLQNSTLKSNVTSVIQSSPNKIEKPSVANIIRITHLTPVITKPTTIVQTPATLVTLPTDKEEKEEETIPTRNDILLSPHVKWEDEDNIESNEFSSQFTSQTSGIKMVSSVIETSKIEDDIKQFDWKVEPEESIEYVETSPVNNDFTSLTSPITFQDNSSVIANIPKDRDYTNSPCHEYVPSPNCVEFNNSPDTDYIPASPTAEFIPKSPSSDFNPQTPEYIPSSPATISFLPPNYPQSPTSPARVDQLDDDENSNEQYTTLSTSGKVFLNKWNSEDSEEMSLNDSCYSSMATDDRNFLTTADHSLYSTPATLSVITNVIDPQSF